MVYRITVDGKRCYAEAAIREYSLEADNKAREAIIQRYLDEEGAQEVTFGTSIDEARALHRVAADFYDTAMDFCRGWNGFPRDKTWGVEEMRELIPQLMRVYIAAMKLPDPEHIENAKYDKGMHSFDYNSNFSEEYQYYWSVFDPYCKADLYEDSSGGDSLEGLAKEWLTDDLASTITEISMGISAYQAGLVCEAIFEWRFGLISHYGHHLMGALGAMCSVWEKDEIISDREDRKYWAGDE